MPELSTNSNNAFSCFDLQEKKKTNADKKKYLLNKRIKKGLGIIRKKQGQ